MPPLPVITKTSCNLRRNIETTQSKNVRGTGCKMQMQKQDNCQEIMYEVVKYEDVVKLQQGVRIATKEFVKILPKGFGRPNQELNSVNIFQN